jgi:uncharacterized protein YijF (DUF1287 family)
MKKSLILTAIIACTSPASSDTFRERLVAAAMERTKHTRIYDPSYVKLSYPMGDVADDRGVCSDVIIRAFRGTGIDLQQRVHNDMARNFSRYPKRWGLKSTDKNIDHRRVPNLRVFFKRHGKSLPVTQNPDDYKPGDIVSWDLTGTKCCGFARLAHIGIVSDQRSADGKRPLIVHNMGAGTRLQDMLLNFTITGHYRYGK